MELKYRNNLLFGLGFLFFIGGFAFGPVLFCSLIIDTSFSSDLRFSDIPFYCYILMIFGIIFMCGAVLPYKRRAYRLKQDGDCYESEVTDIRYLHQGRLGFSVIVECVYTSRDGKRCLVRANNLCPVGRNLSYNVIGNFTAKVWVHPDNPKDYYVGVMYNGSKSGDSAKFDNDYR